MRDARLVMAAFVLLSLSLALPLPGGPPAPAGRGDRMIADYFRDETRSLTGRVLGDVRTSEDWDTRRPELRRQLFEMLGLDPLPERTDLKATVTGTLEHDTFVVEKLHFQSRPGLYVTANLYIPRGLTGPAPAVLYLCGHAAVEKGGVSFGNKVAYQHHAIWFARHGFVCLVLDSLQLGEIRVGSSRVDLQACKLEYSIVSPK